MKSDSNSAVRALRDNNPLVKTDATHKDLHLSETEEVGEHGQQEVKLMSRNDIEEIIDILKQSPLEKEIYDYWNDPQFLELVNDPKFQAMLDDICQHLCRRFKASSIYTWDDLKQDVLANFGKWFPQYRGEAQPRSVLYKIAYNQLVDVSRHRDERCSSFEALGLENGYGATSLHHEKGDIEGSILVNECASKLTSARDRQLFDDYFVQNKTASEIAAERGVTRQAVAKQLARVVNLLRPFIL